MDKIEEFPVQEAPEDLSVKKTPEKESSGREDDEESQSPQSGSRLTPPSSAPSRKLKKPIPPPLDLNARTLEEPQCSAKAESFLESLPIRKRPLLEVRQDLHNIKSPKSTVPCESALGPAPGAFQHVLPSGLHHPPSHFYPHLSSSAAVAAAAAAAAAAASSTAPSSPLHSAPPRNVGSSYPWAAPAPLFPHPFSPVAVAPPAASVIPHSPLPFHSTALLSPAPSYPSSTNSSREDLPLQHAATLAGDEVESKRRLLSSHSSVSPSLLGPAPVPADSSTGSSFDLAHLKRDSIGSEPLRSPDLSGTWSHGRPIPSWQCFLPGTLIRFLLSGLDTPWQKAEDLGWKDKQATLADPNSYQFAPHGLVLLKIDVVNRDLSATAAARGFKSEPEVSSSAEKILALRMAPYRGETADLLVECALEHPFFVKEKGWSSAHPRLTQKKYSIPCAELALGDVCLPPNHPDAVRTPDLSDRLRRFDFDVIDSEPATPTTKEAPKSPRVAKLKKDKEHGGSKDDTNKPKRPMNGFMLFAKKYRLEFNNQNPGKDNRAISVLLGEAWKALPVEERESYSAKAKTMADEQKKLFPDCWKRKRTLNNEKQQQQSKLTQQQQLQVPGVPPASSRDSSSPKTYTQPTTLNPNAVISGN